ncbi:MAG TPA: diacylglycerol kinase family protein [Vicinamibacteria bacterium]|nr:diacylglycerol kinase family protein [Vicinamibacteria bacterium]
MKVRAILNPRAGVRGSGTLEAIERGRPSWDDYAVYMTRSAGHASELAREAVAAGAEIVIAVGGDGTVNEVAQALLGSPAALGIVPAGSGNGLARALRLPLQPAGALAALEAGGRRRMDVGELNGQLFLNVAGAGFDAVVGRSFHEQGKRGARRGLLGYVRRCLLELRSYRPPRVAIEMAGERLELDPFVLTFANGPQYGSGATINPGAKIDDGRLEVVVFVQAPLWRVAATGSRMFLGGLERSSGYRRLSGPSATVTTGAPVTVHCDGDPRPPVTRIAVELRRAALEVVAPAATLADPDGPFVAR